MVRSVKEPLRKCLGIKLWGDWQFYTLLTQIESILNNRPLTALTQQTDDELPITPAMLFQGHNHTQVSKDPTPQDLQTIQAMWISKATAAAQFWTRWQKDYLMSLKTYQKWHFKNPKELKVGQLVLIMSENVKRGQWPLARVLEVTKGRDDLQRSALLKTTTATLRRPVQKLVPLECDLESENAD